jgi:hypothetical protein
MRKRENNMAFVPSPEKIKDIVRRRLLSLPIGVKAGFPSVLTQEPVSWLSFGDDKLLVLIFIDKADQERIQLYKKRNIQPFPGLITIEKNIAAAIRLENSRNNIFANCSVVNSISFSLGPDCTVVISDHSQILNGTDIGDIEYKIRLAYIVSFGFEITYENVYEYLEDLIAYSIKQWRHTNG